VIDTSVRDSLREKRKSPRRATPKKELSQEVLPVKKKLTPPKRMKASESGSLFAVGKKSRSKSPEGSVGKKSPASKSRKGTPVKQDAKSAAKIGTREKWKEFESIKTDKDICQIPGDFKAFQKEIHGDRDTFISKLKQMAVERGFKVRTPYADRFDKQGMLQITFLCAMAHFFHRNKPGFHGCDFRLVYKATNEKVKSFKLSHYNDEHCHLIAGGETRIKDESSIAPWNQHEPRFKDLKDKLKEEQLKGCNVKTLK